MKGLDLAERYFEEIGFPMLQQAFGPYMDRLAAGLVGDGSECSAMTIPFPGIMTGAPGSASGCRSRIMKKSPTGARRPWTASPRPSKDVDQDEPASGAMGGSASSMCPVSTGLPPRPGPDPDGPGYVDGPAGELAGGLYKR